MNLAPNITNLLFISAAIFGLVICLFGYRILRFLLAVTGFLVGALLSVAVVLAFTQESILHFTKGSDFLVVIGAGLAGGLILSIILLFLYSAGVFLLGALFGIILFSGIIATFDIIIEPILYVIPALFCGIVALLLQKFMIILMTAAIGAWLSVISVIYLISSKFDPANPEFINNIGDIELYRLILGWIALSGLGFLIQYFIFPKKGIPEHTMESSDEV